MTLDKMKSRRKALNEMLKTWKEGGNLLRAEEDSQTFQKLSTAEQDLLRIVFLNEVSSTYFDRIPEGYNGEEYIERSLLGDMR